jgi:hypothetical protein
VYPVSFENFSIRVTVYTLVKEREGEGGERDRERERRTERCSIHQSPISINFIVLPLSF